MVEHEDSLCIWLGSSKRHGKNVCTRILLTHKETQSTISLSEACITTWHRPQKVHRARVSPASTPSRIETEFICQQPTPGDSARKHGTACIHFCEVNQGCRVSMMRCESSTKNPMVVTLVSPLWKHSFSLGGFMSCVILACCSGCSLCPSRPHKHIFSGKATGRSYFKRRRIVSMAKTIFPFVKIM